MEHHQEQVEEVELQKISEEEKSCDENRRALENEQILAHASIADYSQPDCNNQNLIDSSSKRRHKVYRL